METISNLLAPYLCKLNEHLTRLLPLLTGPSQTLSEAGYYSILSGGKRIRPLLPLLVVAGHSKDPTAYLDAICSLELIHTYSLIHDDLPSMDDDDFRRGKPSLHKAYSEASAILTGDFLLTYAFELITKSKRLPPPSIVKLVSVLAYYSGGFGLLGGQMEDLANSMQNMDALEKMYAKKTSSLFSCALAFGAILVEDHSHQEILQQMGYHMGIVFQYLDDLQDEDGCKKWITKTLIEERCRFHFDELRKKSKTLPSTYHLLNDYLFNQVFLTLS